MSAERVPVVFHFTEKSAFNAIRSQLTWMFEARQPPCEHPKGAYFTTLSPGAPKLAARLRIPKMKTEFVFEFADQGDLLPLSGGRGEYVLYAPDDYPVERPRQGYHGPSEGFSP